MNNLFTLNLCPECGYYNGSYHPFLLDYCYNCKNYESSIGNCCTCRYARKCEYSEYHSRDSISWDCVECIKNPPTVVMIQDKVYSVNPRVSGREYRGCYVRADKHLFFREIDGVNYMSPVFSGKYVYNKCPYL